MKINHSFQINSLLKMICDRFEFLPPQNSYPRFGGEIIFKWSVAGTTTLDRECVFIMYL
jgi:hypothetical protein